MSESHSIHYHALVPAAGSGARFGGEVPKQYQRLADRPMIHHALETLCRSPRLSGVSVLLSPVDTCWDSYDWSALGGKLQVLRCGGGTRAETVANGLAALAERLGERDWVLVHDAARPCLSAAMLENLCVSLQDDEIGGLLAVPVADTLKRADAMQRVAATASRTGLWQAQTPQMFRYGLLRRALATQREVTDEAGAVEAAGFKPRLIAADATNFKVTYPADLALAELVLKERTT